KKHIASLQENIQSSLRTAVLLAQTEAIKRSDEVVVCPLQSRDSIRCADPVTWRNGWLVFVDGDGDMLYSAGSDELIRINIMDENPFYAEYSAACFSLNAQGYFKATDSVFTVCADDGTLDPVAYTILKYGEFMPLSDTDGNGNPNDLNGDDLVCK
ncbi:MAG: GspH/FimT family protein, partial [Gammaproteobacteria bacterium]